MKSANILVGVGLLLGASGLVWHAAGPHGAAGREALPPETASSLEDLRAEVARLRSETRRSGLLATAAAEAAATAHPERPVPVPSGAGTLPEAALAQVPPPAVSAQVLEDLTAQRFREEVRDPAWQASADGTARKQWGEDVAAGGEARDVECKATMCRANLVFASEAAYGEAMKRLSTSLPAWQGGGLWSAPRPQSDGKIVVERYLFRDGTDPLAEIYAEERAGGGGDSPVN